MGGSNGPKCSRCGSKKPRYVCRSCGSNWCHDCHSEGGGLRWGKGICAGCGDKSVVKR